MSLAHLSLLSSRARIAGRIATVDQMQHEIELLREELRIKDIRMSRISAHRRPHYLPTERFAIFELRAMRGWSLSQTARAFLVTTATVASWMTRLDEQGLDALFQIRQSVNRFPEFVRYLVQRLKVLCPQLGKAKLAQSLARAGLHLAATTIGRMLKQPASPSDHADHENSVRQNNQMQGRGITAKCPNHVWHVDLTVVPMSQGFWTAWLPFSLPQIWPFAWWLAFVVDQYSRRLIGFAVFKKQPKSKDVRAFLDRAIRNSRPKPKYLISDQGGQFVGHGYQRWCRRRKITPRFGAVDRYGSIAVVERFIRTMKNELTRRIVVPLGQPSMRHEIQLFADWYNGHRPHAALDGRTSNELYDRRRPANRRPRIEPRVNWPRGSPCARPQTLVAGKPGDRTALHVDYHAGRKHLPIVTLERVA